MNLHSRIFGIVLAAGLGAVAHASPTVGDWTEWNAEYTLSGHTYVGTSRFDLVEYNAQTLQYLKRYTTVLDGQSQVDDRWVDGQDVASKERAEYYVANCTRIVGAVLDPINFNGVMMPACKVPIDDARASGFIWVAAVPDLAGQSDLVYKNNGAHYVLRLKDYRWVP